ncbi:MAG: SUMF1/EgtB/PvdO family nonheme iron enzyme, partial [Pirellulales bacterium]
LVEVFPNLLLLREEPGHALLEPIPLRKTPKPPAIAEKVDLANREATVYLSDIYAGDGLRGIPRGTVKSLRIFTYHYAYQKMGGLLGVVGMDGPWDIKRVIGTVPVFEDGSAKFHIPANTPISIQPLDEQGKALQLMRSWMTAMPGEVVACSGCHASPRRTPRPLPTQAQSAPVAEVKPWYGPTRGFSYAREVQPVIDKYCLGCHDGATPASFSPPDLRGDVQITDWRSVTPGNGGVHAGKFSLGYAELHRYVRRPGIESDYHMLEPMEFHADTTELVQMLDKGHHNVRLDAEAWDRLITWIDLNCPYHGTWGEQIDHPGLQRRRRRELLKRYAGIDDDPEAVLQTAATNLSQKEVDSLPRPGDVAVRTGLGTGSKNVAKNPPNRRRFSENRRTEPGFATAPKKVEPVLPEPSPLEEPQVVTCPDWPFPSDEARRRQQAAGAKTTRTVELGNGVALKLVRIPAGQFIMGSRAGGIDERPVKRVRVERPFWIGTCEVTNEQFHRFDAFHDSRVESKNAYQFGIHGYPVNRPEQPVVRVSWNEAVRFCDWLSQRTGLRFTLPTEMQWEYACRAGTATSLFYGDLDADFSKFANLADATLSKFASDPYTVDTPLVNPPKYDDWIPKESRFNDGSLLSVAPGHYRPNAWGLFDMHGNVAEWTRTATRPYPHDAADGRDTLTVEGRRVVRGGSWRDRPERCTSSFRVRYAPYQRVFNVGFRVVCELRTDEARR